MALTQIPPSAKFRIFWNVIPMTGYKVIAYCVVDDGHFGDILSSGCAQRFGQFFGLRP